MNNANAYSTARASPAPWSFKNLGNICNPPSQPLF